MEEKNYTRKIYMVLLFLAIILTGFLCKILAGVLLPVITAAFLSFALLPAVRFLTKKTKIPWTICSLFLVIITFVILMTISTLLGSSLSTIVSEYPKYENKFMSIYKIVAARLNLQIDEGQSFIQNIQVNFNLREYVQKIAITLSSGLISIGKTTLTIFLLMSFLLLEIRYSSEKINAAFDGETKHKVKSISNHIVSDVIRFISIKFVVSFFTAILVYIICLIVKMDFPIVWAFLAFIMNFIPIFGSIISCISTTLFALLQFYPESLAKVIAIFILMLLINFSIGNVIEPRIEGKHLGLSAFVILVSLSVWGYIWGFAGMLFAVPIMVIIKIICENVDYLHPIAILLGNNKTKEIK